MESNTSNLLSQLITNLGNLIKQLAAVLNLPPACVTIQKSAEDLIQSDIDKLKSIQSQTLDFTKPAIDELNTALSKLNSGDTSGALPIVSKVNADATTLDAAISASADQIMATKVQILSLSSQLSTNENALNNEMVGLQSKAEDAKKQADYYTSRKYYFLALGPLGLIGLGIAIGMIASWTKKANSFNAQVSQLEVQISTIKQLVANIDTLISTFTKGVTQVSNIKNAVGFLQSNLQNVIDDLNNANGQNAILLVTTALHECQSLESDAS
ncbi:hypothetical protein ACPX19_12510 [Winogradskyella sp. HB-48]|uniref:hypothetical protein n=1 Tax=Winogradskyella sp. HB-48 TaxID=3416808 RepID=UPI003CF976B1